MSELTTRILQEIRSDVRDVRERLGGVESDLADVKSNVRVLTSDVTGLKSDASALKAGIWDLSRTVKAFTAHKERDTILLADDMEEIKRRLDVCEDKLDIERD